MIKNFRHDLKKILKKYEYKKEVIKEFNEVLKLLLFRKKLPEKYQDHSLTGNYITYRECHILLVVLLIYKADEQLSICIE